MRIEKGLRGELADAGRPVVLVVDDDHFIRHTIREALEPFGFAVVEAETGPAALERLMELPPDLILLDVIMPGMDGFEVCRQIRAVPEGAHLPVVMATVLEDTESINRAYGAGATDFITKPLNYDILGHRLRYILRASETFAALRRSQDRLAQAQRIARLGHWEWDLRRRKLKVSEEVRRLLAQDAGQWPEIGSPMAFLRRMHPEDRLRLRQEVRTALANPGPVDFDFRLCAPATEKRFLHLQAEVACDGRGRPEKLFGTLQDVTERTRSQESLRLAGEVYEHSSEAILITDAQVRIIDVNPAFTAMTGFSRQEVLGKNPRFLQSGQHDAGFYRKMWDSLHQSGQWQGEIWNRDKSGNFFPELLTINAVKNGRGQTTHYIGIATDISRLKESEAHLLHLAHFDQLTRLPNRALFRDRLQQSLFQAEREGWLVAVLFLDLDCFKDVNDSLGHQAGDQLLRTVARRLDRFMRKSNTVARLGGDEFTILLQDVVSLENVALVAGRIMGAFAEPFMVDDREIFISASIGIAIYPNDGQNAETLLKNADTAMYHAKNQGRGQFQFFSEEMQTRVNHRLAMQNSLRRAVDREEFALLYQPRVDLASGSVVGVEALLRWRRPGGKLVAPGEFIAMAEETGLILPIGEWVLRTACLQNMAWAAKSPRPLRMAVNLSVLQLKRQNIHALIMKVLQETGLPPAGLELELTESILMENIREPLADLAALKEAGVHISVDDFGVGYSSLSYLQRLPVHALKIDQSFVREIVSASDDAVIVKTIIAMARSLGLKVVAEGVETPQQMAFLRRQGCDEAQGFLISHPLPAADLLPFLAHFRMP